MTRHIFVSAVIAAFFIVSVQGVELDRAAAISGTGIFEERTVSPHTGFIRDVSRTQQRSSQAPGPAERSSNWTGYVAYQRVHTVEATWVLQSIPVKKNLPTWIGLGGDGGCPSVVQAGTSHFQLPDREVYSIWWETWDPTGDAPPVNVPVTGLAPGSTIRIRVSVSGTTAHFDYWMGSQHIAITHALGSFPVCRNSADFVSESLDGPFAFGRIPWSNCMIDGRPLSTYKLTPILLENAKHEVRARPLPVHDAAFALMGW
jgi:hypothetical protein